MPPYGQKSLTGLVPGRTDWTPRSGGLSSLQPRSEKNLPAGAFYFARLCIARITALYLRPLCCCVCVNAPGWGLSSRACHLPRRPRLPVPIGFMKSSMTAFASWRDGMAWVSGSLLATETISRRGFPCRRRGDEIARPFIPARRRGHCYQ
jgi:hypothetical protein